MPAWLTNELCARPDLKAVMVELNDPVYIDHKIIEGFFAMPGYEIQIDLDGGGGGTEGCGGMT